MDGLAARRKAAGYTQSSLASLLGVSQAAVAAWESGIKLPSAHKLPSIAAALHCTIDDLYKAPA